MLRIHTVKVATWGKFGSRSPLGVIRVRLDGIKEIDQAIADSIARRLGCKAITVRYEGYEDVQKIGAGVIAREFTFVVTVGKRCPSGGYTPEAEVWFSYSKAII